MDKLALALLLSLAAAGCGPPIRNTPIAEIPKIATLAEVMDNQATVMDPLFKKIGQSQFSDEEWAAMTAAGNRVEATSVKIKDFSKGAEFDAVAMKLNQYATDLTNSYTNKNAAAANDALANMKATCKECHKKFR